MKSTGRHILLFFIFSSLFFIFSAPAFCASDIRINEVAPSEATYTDWIELYVANGGSDLSGYKLYEGNVLIKTFPSFTPTTGDYIVVQCTNTAASDETAGKGANGYWDLYISSTVDTGLTATDNVIILKNGSDTIIDSMAFSDQVKGSTPWEWTPSAAATLELKNMVAAGQWTCTTEPSTMDSSGQDKNIEYFCVANMDVYNTSTLDAGDSFGRDASSTDTDASGISSNDWYVFDEGQTMGVVNSAPSDTTPPSAINSLDTTGTKTDTAIELTWTAVGDDAGTGTAARYIVRYSTNPIETLTGFCDATDFSNGWSPLAATNPETHSITGLTPSTTYWFAIIAEDDTYLKGGLSNTPVSALTLGDTTAPAAVTDLGGAAGTGCGTVDLTWTAPGDDGTEDNNTGLAYYTLKYSTKSVADVGGSTVTWWVQASTYTQTWAVSPAHTTQTERVMSLYPGQKYYFALKTTDDGGNLSDIDDKALLGGTHANGTALTTANADMIVNEVLPDGGAYDDNNEFIELYNRSGSPIDVSGWKFSDGDALDTIEAWDEATHGNITDPDPTFNTTIVPAGGYAVILDEEYEAGNQPYDFPSGVIILTCANTTLGDGLTPSNDPITLYDGTGYAVSTYGTPIGSSSTISAVADDDGNDSIPYDPDTDKSVERKDPSKGDFASNWGTCLVVPTPGEENSYLAPPDETAPSAVSNLTALPGPTEGTVKLTWTAPGNDGTTGGLGSGCEYKIWASTNPISFIVSEAAGGTGATDPVNWSQSFSTSSVSPKDPQDYIVTTLDPGTTYYFAIRTKDESDNWSVWPGTSGAINTLSKCAALDLPPDLTPPDEITDLVASAGTGCGTVDLTWTAPGDDGTEGNNTGTAYYTLRYSTKSVADVGGSTTTWWVQASTYTQTWTVSSSHSEENKTLYSLYPGQKYYFAIKTTDDGSNTTDVDDKALLGGTQANGTAFATANAAVIINEVMANATNESYGEYIELYNRSAGPIDVSAWQFTDGDALDTIIAWNEATHGDIDDPDPTFDTTIIPAGGYAVIVNTNYDLGQVYDFPSGTVLLTCNASIGDSGLTNTNDPVTLYDGTGYAVSTYGTPIGSISGSYGDADDDGNDSIPYDPGNGVSAERKSAFQGDFASNWSTCLTGSTPGAKNSNTPDETAPAAVSNLTALVGPVEGSVKLTWTAPGNDAMTGDLGTGSQYKIWASTNPISFVVNQAAGGTGATDPVNWSQTFSTSSVSPSDAQDYIVTTLDPGATYYFAIRTKDAAGNWSVWPGTSGVINTLSKASAYNTSPSSPTGLSLTPGYTKITLDWADNPESDLKEYRVFFGTITSGVYDHPQSPKTASVSSYTLTALTNFTTYYIAVRAVDDKDLSSPLSGEKSAYPALDATTISAAAAVTGYSDRIYWEWDYLENADNGYRVYSSTGGLLKTIGVKSTTYWTETGKSPNTQYTRYVVGLDVNTDEGYGSDPVSCCTFAGKAQNITYSDRTDSSITLTWTAPTGGALKYAVERAGSELGQTASAAYQDTGLAAGTEYLYRIKAYNASGLTDAASVSDYASVSTLFITAPEPDRGFVTPGNPVTFGSEAEELKVFDARGNEIMSTQKGSASFITWDGSSSGKQVESGPYIYKIKTKDGKTKFGTIILAK